MAGNIGYSQATVDATAVFRIFFRIPFAKLLQVLLLVLFVFGPAHVKNKGLARPSYQLLHKRSVVMKFRSTRKVVAQTLSNYLDSEPIRRAELVDETCHDFLVAFRL